MMKGHQRASNINVNSYATPACKTVLTGTVFPVGTEALKVHYERAGGSCAYYEI